MHHCVFNLTDALGGTGELSSDDAVIVCTTLREQRDAGQELDQWLVLAGLDLLLYRLGHRVLATNIRRSFESTVWASRHNRDHLSAVPQEDELEEAAIASSGRSEVPIDELVTEVLQIVEALAS